MNIENINVALAIMTRHMEAQLPLDMTTWQHYNRHSATALKEEHLCGTPCCMAGYIAVSPEFQADGGGLTDLGAPEFNGRCADAAIREWLGCTHPQAKAITATANEVVAYPDVINREIEFSDVIAALVSLRDTGLLPGE